MADGVAQLGTIESIEVELANVAGVKPPAQFSRHGGGNQLPRGGAFIEPPEQGLQPPWDGRATQAAHPLHAGKAHDRHDAGDDLGSDARSGRLVAKAEEALGFEEELGDRAGGPGVELALEIVEIGLLVSSATSMVVFALALRNRLASGAQPDEGSLLEALIDQPLES